MKTLYLSLSICSLLLLAGVNAVGSGDSTPAHLEDTHQLVGRMDLLRDPYKDPSVDPEFSSPGVEIEGARVRIEKPAMRWKGHWNAGQYRLPASGQLILKARVDGGKASFNAVLFGGRVLRQPELYETEDGIVTIIWNIEGEADERISGLWVDLRRDGRSSAEVEILDFSLWEGDLY